MGRPFFPDTEKKDDDENTNDDEQWDRPKEPIQAAAREVRGKAGAPCVFGAIFENENGVEGKRGLGVLTGFVLDGKTADVPV